MESASSPRPRTNRCASGMFSPTRRRSCRPPEPQRRAALHPRSAKPSFCPASRRRGASRWRNGLTTRLHGNSGSLTSAAARPRRCRLTCRKAGSCHSRKIYPTARSSNADRRGHHSTRNKQRWNGPVHQEVEMFELDVAQGTSQGAVSPFSHSQLNGRFCGETGPDRGESCTRAIRPFVTFPPWVPSVSSIRRDLSNALPRA